jgi:hypothetical protein
MLISTLSATFELYFDTFNVHLGISSEHALSQVSLILSIPNLPNLAQFCTVNRLHQFTLNVLVHVDFISSTLAVNQRRDRADKQCYLLTGGETGQINSAPEQQSL